MKIKTITCHDVYNSGASLQAYALQRYISSMGHSVEIIDYKPKYLSGHFKTWRVSNPRWDKNIFLKTTYLILKLPSRLISLKKKRAFDKFRDKYLTLTNRRFISNEELRLNPPIADLYIAGSDQIWNTIFSNGTDAAFYLNFAPKSSKRISYAASFATSHIVEQHKAFVKRELGNFDSISVREQDGLEIVKELGYDGEWVCDPVFLLTAEQWDQIALREFKQKYILIYDFEKTPLIEQIAKKIAKEKGWKIYSVNIALTYADRCFRYVAPDDFVSLIKSSQMVISNSFHGTAFSVIYEKDFLVVPRKEGINTRMVSLLSYLGIPERMATNNQVELGNIDYSKVNIKLNEYTTISKQFLKYNLVND